MFLGEAQHSLDAKGRVILPAEFRDQLADGAVVAKGLDGCLRVYPREDFQQMAGELYEKAKRGERERHAARAVFGGAKEVVPDKQGRVPIPQQLREYATLERDVFIVGQYTHLEIWDAPRWLVQREQGADAIRAGEGLDDFM
jgi:MraZ protein